MIRMYEKQTAFTTRQVLAVILALILMSAFLPSRAAVAEDEPFIEIEDIEWDENAFVILDDPIYFMGDEDMEVPVITSAGKTNVKVNGVKSKNKLVKYTIPEMLLILDPNFMDLMIEAEKYIGYPYVYGGSSPETSFDCSGFVCWVLNHSGVYSTRRLGAQGLYSLCTDIPREEYEECEERVIRELRELGKPFVVILNTVDPDSTEAKALADELTERYDAKVVPVNCLELTEGDIRGIMREILFSFPIKEINIRTARWINALDKGHWLKSEILDCIRNAAKDIRLVREAEEAAAAMGECPSVVKAEITSIDLGKGSVTITAELDNSLFYKILGETTGIEIESESDLMPLLSELNDIRRKYKRIEPALAEVEATGYGIVMPELEEMSLEEPKIIRQGGKYGVKLKASAPSIHLMKANINTTISPIVGTERQSEELVMYLLDGFDDDPKKIWESNIFGKSLHELVNEGLHSKLFKMPVDARMKLQETLERVINEGCSGLICFIL